MGCWTCLSSRRISEVSACYIGHLAVPLTSEQVNITQCKLLILSFTEIPSQQQINEDSTVPMCDLLKS